jgi:4-hydroxybenzoate polyprenyltransferase
MDEYGMRLGETATRRRSYGTAMTKVHKAPDNKEWISAIESISADGRVITPLLIYKGVHTMADWFPATGEVEVAFTATRTAYSNAEVFCDWFRDVFLPETKPPTEDTWRLLIMDGHLSHTSDEVIDLAWNTPWCSLFPPLTART